MERKASIEEMEDLRQQVEEIDYQQAEIWETENQATEIEEQSTNPQLISDDGSMSAEQLKGQIKDNEIYRYQNGDIYRGKLISNKREGFGIYSYSNGARYEGY